MDTSDKSVTSLLNLKLAPSNILELLTKSHVLKDTSSPCSPQTLCIPLRNTEADLANGFKK